MPDGPDYKELYFKLFRASEQAIRLLIAAQQECEELYLSSIHSPGRRMRPPSRTDDAPPVFTGYIIGGA